MIEQCVFVLALHGAGGTGQAMNQILANAPANWQKVSPSSPTMMWNINPNSSDEKWLVRITRKNNCDTKVVTGFSNGGYMSSALLCRHPNLFDGAFSVNGVTKPKGCFAKRTSFFTAVSGEVDPIVNWNGQVAPFVYDIIPTWAIMPAKTAVKTMNPVQVKQKTKTTNTFKETVWNNYSWVLEYNKGHEWTTTTTKLFYKFVKKVDNG